MADPLVELLNRLPTDLVANILGRVPIKYLAGLKCVSKTSCSFLQNHLNINRFHQSNREPILVAQSRAYTGKILNLYRVDPKGESTLIYTSTCSDTFFKSKFCNGLICSFDGYRSFNLHNLATNEVVKLPSIHAGHWFEFGYNSIREEYKVLTRLNGRLNSDPRFMIYTLGTNSWRVIQNQPAVRLNQHQVTSFCMNGKFYWYTPDSTIILFDMCSEEFGKVQCPQIQFNDILRMKNVEGPLLELEGKLCLVDVLCSNESYPTKLDLWILRDDWVLMKSITLPYMTRCLETPFCNRCGEIVIATRSVNGCNDIYLYSLLTEQVDIVATVRLLSSEDLFVMKHLESYF